METPEQLPAESDEPQPDHDDSELAPFQPTRDELVKTVARKTQGTAEAPLTEATIAKVVDATLRELGLELRVPLDGEAE